MVLSFYELSDIIHSVGIQDSLISCNNAVSVRIEEMKAVMGYILRGWINHDSKLTRIVVMSGSLLVRV